MASYRVYDETVNLDANGFTPVSSGWQTRHLCDDCGREMVTHEGCLCGREMDRACPACHNAELAEDLAEDRAAIEGLASWD